MQEKTSDAKIREQVDRLGRPTIEMLDEEIVRQERKESYIRLARGVLITLLTVVAAIILITNLWVTALQIDGSSMKPLLETDEIVLAVKDDTIEKNDIIAFYVNNKFHIKRVIAVAGDWVNINSEGVVSVNGTALDEPYVTEQSLGNCDIELPFYVESGTFFVLGDYRAVSMDSRDSRFGTVSRDQIIGRVSVVVWPPSKIKKIS